MGQAEVIKTLEKKRNWMTAEEIAKLLNVENITLIRRALLVLFRYREVLRKKCENSPHFKYIYKAI
jgi:predicted transcriptional regulator